MIHSLVADASTIFTSPSTEGGTFAWCQVDMWDQKLERNSGIVLPYELGVTKLDNNLLELVACLRGLASLPNGWAGQVWTDNQPAAWNLSYTHGVRRGFRLLPACVNDSLETQLARLGHFSVVLVGGHPTPSDRRRGYKRNGRPISQHHIWCDRECTMQAWKFRQQQIITGVS